MAFWNERLVEHGAHLIARRRGATGALDELAQAIHGQLTGGAERLHLRYAPSVDLGEPRRLTVVEIQAAYQAQIQSLRQRETAAGMTLAGPHRDEMRFMIDDIDAGVYGSRGQQRTAVLALKLAEVELMRHETGDYPVLLLDDVLSELDAHRRQLLLQRVEDGEQQAIITTSDLQALPPGFLQGCRLWRVEMGRLAETS